MNEASIIIGSMMLAFYIPELIASIAKTSMPITANIYAMIAVGLIVSGAIL
jgi:hypothetical protein